MPNRHTKKEEIVDRDKYLNAYYPGLKKVMSIIQPYLFIFMQQPKKERTE